MSSHALRPQPGTLASPKGRISWTISLGSALLGVGIVAPSILPIEAVPVMSHLLQGLRETDSGHVLLAAAWLVGINTLRALPIFLGGFLLAEGVGSFLDGYAKPHELGYIVPASVIPLVYVIINRYHGVDYHFGTPALLAILGIFVVHRLSWHTQGWFNKIVIFSLFLFGLQWLHVVPALTDYGFGAGSISRDIKLSALVLGADAYLTQIAAASTVFTIGLAFVMSKFMVDQTQHLDVVKAQQRQERELLERRVETMAARTAREVENLVHDLKTPLAGVQSLIRTLRARTDDVSVQTPLLQAEHVIENMLRVISETLHPDLQRRVPATSLFQLLQVQFATGEARLKFHIPADLPDLRVNTMRVTRAVSNLIQNALESNAGDPKPVTVKVGVAQGRLRIRIRDHGTGISPQMLPELGKIGYTTKRSTGFGIPFAMGIIVGGHNGDIRFVSKPGLGTLVIVKLPLTDGEVPREDTSESRLVTRTDAVPSENDKAAESGAPEADVLRATMAKLDSSATVAWMSGMETSAAGPSADGTILERPRRILAIDDDPAILIALHFLAAEAGWELVPCESPTVAIRLWQQQIFDIALLDYRMPEMDGLTALRHMRRYNIKTPILMLTVDDNAAVAQRLLLEGANDFISKPIKPVDMMTRLRLHLKDAPTMEALPTALHQLKEEKGVQPQTLEAIVDCIRRSSKPFSAREIADACGVSAATAYRYVTLLERHKWVQATMHYGVTGRPRKLYRWNEP